MQEIKTNTNLKELDCRKKSKSKEKFLKLLNLNNLNICVGLLIVSGIIYYIGGVNDLMVKGFRLRELKTEVSKLQEENREQSIKKTSLESFGSLNERAQKMDMVAAGEIEYITINSGLAKK